MSGRGVFRNMQAGESLDGFHQRCVVPTPQETVGRNAEIDAFVRFLQQQFGQRPYTVAEVVKSGSVGKGTAIRGSADIDLVVFVNGLTSIEDLRDKREYLLHQLKTKVSGYGPWRGRIRDNGHSQFSLSYVLDGHEVDILPAFNILERYSPAVIYDKMRAYSEGYKRAAQQYSASLAPLQDGVSTHWKAIRATPRQSGPLTEGDSRRTPQRLRIIPKRRRGPEIEFVKPQGENVKRVIRLLKLWKKENGLNIRSYTLELMTIHAARSLGGCPSTLTLFREVLTELSYCTNIRIAFNDNYDSTRYTRLQSPPYVMDPANPYMNTVYDINTGAVSAAARVALSKC